MYIYSHLRSWFSFYIGLKLSHFRFANPSVILNQKEFAGMNIERFVGKCEGSATISTNMAYMENIRNTEVMFHILKDIVNFAMGKSVRMYQVKNVSGSNAGFANQNVC